MRVDLLAIAAAAEIFFVGSLSSTALTAGAKHKAVDVSSFSPFKCGDHPCYPPAAPPPRDVAGINAKHKAVDVFNFSALKCGNHPCPPAAPPQRSIKRTTR